MNNAQLYELDDVVAKYSALTTRVRQLNIPERELIDELNITKKDVLIVGGGAARIPANLLLLGNRVTSVELSEKLHAAALAIYPPADFPRLTLKQGDARDLSFLPDNSFDFAYFNGLDLIETMDGRCKAIREMARVVRSGGNIAFMSHSLNGHAFSYKLPKATKRMRLTFSDYAFEQIPGVQGGGIQFKAKPEFVIRQAQDVTGLQFIKLFADRRNRFDYAALTRPWLREFVFPWYLMAFRKP